MEIESERAEEEEEKEEKEWGEENFWQSSRVRRGSATYMLRYGA